MSKKAGALPGLMETKKRVFQTADVDAPKRPKIVSNSSAFEASPTLTARQQSVATKIQENERKDRNEKLFQAVRAVVVDGKRPGTAAGVFGLNPKTVKNWAQANSPESVTHDFEHMNHVNSGRPVIVPAPVKQILKEKANINDMLGSSMKDIKLLRSSDKIVIPGYDPYTIEGSFVKVLQTTRDAWVQENMPHAPPSLFRPIGGTTVYKVSKEVVRGSDCDELAE